MTKQNRTQDSETLYQLSLKQELAIDLVLEGKTDSEVAESVGVSRPTVNIWRNHHPAFMAEINRRRQSLAAGRQARLDSLLDELVSATVDLVQQRDPAMVVTLAKLLFPGMFASRTPIGPTDAHEIFRESVGGDHLQDLLANLDGASPSDLARAEDALMKELADTE